MSLELVQLAAARLKIRKQARASGGRWKPNAGAQTRIIDFIKNNTVDELCYAGQAGGGKSFTAFGLAESMFQNTVFFRRQLKDNQGAEGPIFKSHELWDGRGTYNGSQYLWRLEGGHSFQFAGLLGHRQVMARQGVPADLLVFDELTHYPRTAVDYVSGWRRSTTPGQKTLKLFLFNPPIDSTGAWVSELIAPWVKPDHPRPAAEGEIRYFFTRKDGTEIEVDGPDRQLFEGKVRRPTSRTFFRSILAENPTYAQGGYSDVLDALPEQLREILKEGNFFAHLTDQPDQVIPCAWIARAQDRRREQMARGYDPRFDEGGRPTPADSWGQDVAHGGADSDVIVGRWGDYFEDPFVRQGEAVDSGQKSAAALLERLGRHGGYAWVDSEPSGSVDFSRAADPRVQAFVSGAALELRSKDVNLPDGSTRPGVFGFANCRAYAWWRMREELDPGSGREISLPLHPHVFADLSGPRVKYGAKLLIEPKEKIKERLGRSPDVGEAIIMANLPPRLQIREAQAWLDMALRGQHLRV